MKKKELIEKLAKRTGKTFVETNRLINELLAIITEELDNDQDISVLGFGRLYPHRQTTRPVRNPKTGEGMMLVPRTTVRFKPGKYLLEDLNTKP